MQIYLPASNSVDFITMVLNSDCVKEIENKLLDIFTNHVQIVNKPTHISGSLMDHVYIKKTLMEEFSITVNVENICFLDHDALRISTEKISVDFQISL